MRTNQKNPFEPFFEEIRQIIRAEIGPLKASQERLLTPDQLAEAMQIPLSWVYEQSRIGAIPTHRLV